MAEGIDFKFSNTLFTKPEDMTDEECYSLHAYTDGSQIVSCWKLSPEELEELNKTGVIWVGIYGQVQPPMYLTIEYPFIDPEVHRPPCFSEISEGKCKGLDSGKCGDCPLFDPIEGEMYNEDL